MFKDVKENVEMYKAYKKMLKADEDFILDASVRGMKLNDLGEKSYDIDRTIGLYVRDMERIKTNMETMRRKSIVIRFLETIGRV